MSPPTGRSESSRAQALVAGSSPRPVAVLVCGAPGSGKSTVGALMAPRLRAALLDLDSATASLTAVISGLQGTDNLDDPELARLTRAARYESITCLAEDNLAVGINVVMVAPFTAERRDPRAWEALQRRMARVGASTTMVWLRITAEDVLKRVEKRGAPRDVSKLHGNWAASLDLAPPAVPHVEVNALDGPAIIAETAMSSLPVEQGS